MAKGNYLSREGILESAIETRDVEAFGGTVCVRELSAKAMADLLKSGAYARDTGELDFSKIDLNKLCATHIVNPDTQERVLHTGDVEKLATKSWKDIVRIATAALEVSGIDVETQEITAKQGEEQQKNE